MIWDILSYLLLFIVLGGGGFAAYLFLRDYLNGGAGPGTFFGPKPEKRLDVVEQWSLDARRRLVLIRRDDVEHLIMTGGPVDVVIETGIGEKRRPTEPVAEAPAVYSRPARTFAAPTAAGPAKATPINGGAANSTD